MTARTAWVLSIAFWTRQGIVRSVVAASLQIPHLSDRAVHEIGGGMPGTAGSEQRQHLCQRVYRVEITRPCEFVELRTMKSGETSTGSVQSLPR